MLSHYDYLSIRKIILLGYKVLELKLVSFGKSSLESFKKGELKLFYKFVFKDLRLWNF